MTPEQLRASILKSAFEGKLVEQNDAEGSSEHTYKEIIEDKNRLEKAKIIKKSKKIPEISDDEMPYDIPASWRWVRLNDIVYNHGQKTPEDKFSYIDIGSIDNLHQKLNSEETIIEADKAPSRARKIVELGDIIYSTVRPYLHNTCIIDKEFSYQPIASTGFAVMTCHKGLYNKYLFYYLLSPTFDHYANATDNSKGVAYPAINDDKLYRAIIPLPSYEEQKRIVSKIEELLPFVDRYAEAYEKLEKFNAKFPEDMKKSILQYAIQGKLVEQRAEEGTAEDLWEQIQDEIKELEKAKVFKVKDDTPISDDEIPFDIPDSWKWVRIGQIINIESGKGLTAKQMKAGDIPVYGGNGVTGYHDEALIHKETVVIGRVGFYCGSVHVTPNEAWVTDNAFITTYPEKNIDRDYLVYVLRFLNLGQNSNATAQPVVSGKKIYPMLLPLPPLKEQKRIVKKIEETIPFCERLIK